jgi:transketolase
MRDTFADYVFNKAKQDNKVRLVTADLGFGVFDKFTNELPDQFINSGITEQATVSMAAGLSEFSSKVFVYSIANFVTFRPLEQIRNDICYHNKNVCLVAVGAGFSYGALGYSHHLIEDLAIMSPLPNLKIFSPSTPREVQLSLDRIFENNSPSYLRLGRSLIQGDLTDEAIFEDSGFRYLSEGNNGSIVFTGALSNVALEVRDILLKSNLDFSVLSFPFLSETSQESLYRVAKTGPIITIEEHVAKGGMGSLLSSKMNSLNISANIHNYGIKNNSSYEIGEQAHLKKKNNLTADEISNWFLLRIGIR